MSHNCLTELRPDFFDHLKKPLLLTFDNNLIEKVQGGLFDTYNTMTGVGINLLNLSNNKITAIASNALTTIQPTSPLNFGINISNNPLICDTPNPPTPISTTGIHPQYVVKQQC